MASLSGFDGLVQSDYALLFGYFRFYLHCIGKADTKMTFFLDRRLESCIEVEVMIKGWLRLVILKELLNFLNFVRS